MAVGVGVRAGVGSGVGLAITVAGAVAGDCAAGAVDAGVSGRVGDEGGSGVGAAPPEQAAARASVTAAYGTRMRTGFSVTPAGTRSRMPPAGRWTL